MELLLKEYKVNIQTIHYNQIEDNILNRIPIYIINLKSNVTRRQHIKYVMKQMKLNYNLVIVNEIDKSCYNTIPNMQITKNKLGCVLSHLYCLRLGLNTGREKFLILEDDVLFHKQFSSMMTDALLYYDFDMLMLGACDFHFKHNSIHKTNISTDISIYKPVKTALGAHANLYSASFAKQLYEFKLNKLVKEYDVDMVELYDKYKIYTCLPNLVVCELSTTNLNHNFGPKHSLMNASFMSKCFPSDFSYQDYQYIIIDFIEHIKTNHLLQKYASFEEIVNAYIEQHPKSFELKHNLLNGGYTIDDLKEIILTV